jgi:hypothetical protein
LWILFMNASQLPLTILAYALHCSSVVLFGSANCWPKLHCTEIGEVRNRVPLRGRHSARRSFGRFFSDAWPAAALALLDYRLLARRPPDDFSRDLSIGRIRLLFAFSRVCGLSCAMCSLTQ